MAAVQAEDHDGVRVMTVHAAKGLEFDVVAVPDLGRELERRPQPRRHHDRPRPTDDGSGAGSGCGSCSRARRQLGLWELADLNEAESEAEAEEGCRLVYVAASRARDRLILSGIYKPADLEPAEERKPSDTPLRRLLPALAERGFDGDDGEVELPGPAADRRRRADRRPPTASGDPESASRANGARPSSCAASRRRAEDGPFASIDEPPPLLDRGPGAGPGRPPLLLGARPLRAVRLPLLRRAGARRPRGARARARRAGRRGARGPATSCRSRASPAAHALGIGNAVHAALEWSAAARLGGAPGDELLARLLAREGLAGDAEALARARRPGRGLARLGAARRALRGAAARRGAVRARRSAAPSSAARSTCSSSGDGRGPDRGRLQDRRARRTLARPSVAARYAAQRAGLRARRRLGDAGARADRTSSSRRPTTRWSRPSTPTGLRRRPRAPERADRADARGRVRGHARAPTRRSASAARRPRASARGRRWQPARP